MMNIDEDFLLAHGITNYVIVEHKCFLTFELVGTSLSSKGHTVSTQKFMNEQDVIDVFKQHKTVFLYERGYSPLLPIYQGHAPNNYIYMRYYATNDDLVVKHGSGGNAPKSMEDVWKKFCAKRNILLSE